MIIQASFVFYLNFEKIKKRVQRKQKLFMILLILVTHMIRWSTVSTEKEQYLPPKKNIFINSRGNYILQLVLKGKLKLGCNDP